MHWEGKTYALTKMWGLKTQEYVDQIIQELNLDNILYKEYGIGTALRPPFADRERFAP